MDNKFEINRTDNGLEFLTRKDAPEYILCAAIHYDNGIEYKGGKIDWEALVIDWECSRYTKKASPLTAREEAWMQYTHGELSATDYEMILATADKLGLDKSYRLLPLHKEFLHKHQNVE